MSVNRLMQMAASSGVSPVGQEAFTTAGTFSWVAPPGVTSISVVCVGAGGGSPGSNSAGGGELRYKNNISVTPGSSYSVVVGAGGTTAPTDGGPSSFNATTVVANGGINANGSKLGGSGGTGDGGGNGGNGIGPAGSYGSGGGAGGYSGNGGNGDNNGNPGLGTGGAGAGGKTYSNNVSPYNYLEGYGGGGVGILGQGANATVPSGGGSGGSNAVLSAGGFYGGGAGAANGTENTGGIGGGGAVRIIWPGTDRQFPSTNTGDIV